MKTKTIIDLLTVTANGHDNPLTVGQAVINTLRRTCTGNGGKST